MKEYIVKMSQTITVEAENEHDAEIQASELFDHSNTNFEVNLTKNPMWNDMNTPDGRAWFGGKTHKQLGNYLPSELNDTPLEDIDFLVVGWRKA